MSFPRHITSTDAAASDQHVLRTEDLDYALPEELIATRPVDGSRDQARMMVVSRSDPTRIEHRQVRDLPAYLAAGDALVFNTSAVARARLGGRRLPSGGRVEGLFLCECSETGDELPGRSTWLVMLRSNGRLRPGDRVELTDACDQAKGVSFELLSRRSGGAGEWIVRVDPPVPTGEAAALLERVGRTPLPPYILQARGRENEVADELDRAWYETVYADTTAGRRQSVAAPTAGLHFTPELLEQLDRMGVDRLEVVLHVGAGTFKPVTAATLSEHIMHAERYEVPPETITALRALASQRSDAAAGNGRVIAVGTTSVRTLESLPEPLPNGDAPITEQTDLMIAPPYRFRRVDGMLTNFHLPRSTLLALVAAMIGLERVKSLYAVAVQQHYRFFSYGDCMLILP